MDEDYTKQYANWEEQHWWFRARRRLLRSFIKRAGVMPEHSVLEIGPGSGLNLYTLYPNPKNVSALEPDDQCCQFIRSRGDIPVLQGTLENWPPSWEDKPFDAIALFDVLEHIENDEDALSSIHQRLKNQGKILLTVPAYQWLWSQHDEINHHYRRYTKKGLVKKLQTQGFRIERATYFNSLLFPLAAPVRYAERWRKNKPVKNEFERSFGFSNEILYHIFRSEQLPLKHINFPFGLSLFVEATKN